MASEKDKRKKMREKKERSIGLVPKEDKINRAISASNKKISATTKKAFEKNQIKKKFSRNKTNTEKTLKKKPLNIPPEYDEAGAIIFKINTNDIVLQLPDFNEKLIIEKSGAHSYEDLISEAVLTCTINQIRAKKRSEKEKGLKDLSRIRLDPLAPISCYAKYPKVDLYNIDNILLDIKPPAYTFVAIDLSAAYHEADKSLKPKPHHINVIQYNENDIGQNDKVHRLYKDQANIFSKEIQKKKIATLYNTQQKIA